MKQNHRFGIWTLPATVGACMTATEAGFGPAHYDAVERAVRRAEGHEITRADVEEVKRAIETHESAICQECGLFHTPPACQPTEAA
jgi:hypothetical protein